LFDDKSCRKGAKKNSDAPASEMVLAIGIACYHRRLEGLRLNGTKKTVARAAIEIAFIIFLFYSNLLMGEFERSGVGQKRGLIWAMADVFTSANFVIAVAAAIVGYIVFEFLRTRF